VLSADLESVLRDAEVVILGNKSASKDQLAKHLRPEQIVIDLIHLDKTRRPEGRFGRMRGFAGRTPGPCWPNCANRAKFSDTSSGLTFSKFGMKVLGSSFPGWTTPYIGFNLNPGVPRRAALEALEKFAWDDLKCLHLEVSDPNFTFEDGETAGFKLEYYASYRTDLTRSEEELFNGMESACRRCIRKAEKSGLKIEEAHDLAFADEYYEQLKDVFAKQSLVPTYSVERVRSLVRNLEPGGNILLLRARDPAGQVHRYRNLSRLQPDRRILGQRQLPFPSEPPSQRSLPLVCHALLEKTRCLHLRLGRRRRLQGKIWLHALSRALVYQVSLSDRGRVAQRGAQHVRPQAKISRLAARQPFRRRTQPGRRLGCKTKTRSRIPVC
jgi:hypothetical protein